MKTKKIAEPKKLIVALIVFAIALELFVVTTNAAKKPQMYKSARTCATLKFKKCASPDMIFEIKNLDKRADHYIVIAGTGLKKDKKIKNEIMRDGCFDKNAIKNNFMCDTYECAGNPKKIYFKVLARDKKTKLYYHESKIYQVDTSNGKVIKTIK